MHATLLRYHAFDGGAAGKGELGALLSKRKWTEFRHSSTFEWLVGIGSLMVGWHHSPYLGLLLKHQEPLLSLSWYVCAPGIRM